MLFVTPPQNAGEIRAFCARFNEGFRVEYKTTFDDNVRRNLPKVVSSFANSLGGVLVVGVNAANGVPQTPVEGFAAPAEELTLTVENICLLSINPPVVPRITIVPSDITGHIFLVIEVDESWEAPHAIENSKRAYVRTGNASNPYDLAEVDLIIELIKRRSEPSSRREHSIALALERAKNVVPDGAVYLLANIVPSYPRRALCANDTIWTFLSNALYRGGRYFPFQTLRRVEDGVASFNREEEYSQASSFGLMLTKRTMQLHREGQGPEFIVVGDVLRPLVKLFHCANAFYTHVGYRGNVEVAIGLNNVRAQRMPFLRDPYGFRGLDHYECFEERVLVSQRSSAELLREHGREIVHDVFRQMCWSFWQSSDDFPATALHDYLEPVIRELGM
jgi:hypothetical protein